MQKFPLRNRCKPKDTSNKPFEVYAHNTRMRPDFYNHHEMPTSARVSETKLDAPRKVQRLCQQLKTASGTSIEKRQLTERKPPVRVCNRVSNSEIDNLVSWNELLRKCQNQGKSLPWAVSSVRKNDEATKEVISPGQRIKSAGGKLEVPCNLTASSSNTRNKNNNENRNKNDENDDDNNRRSRPRSRSQLEKQQQQQEQNHQSKTQTEARIIPAAALLREFITSERLRLGDQINFLLFDPYRTLKFLITELKSRLKTIVPDDINIQVILLEIQQTIKRIRIENARKSTATTTNILDDTEFTTSAEGTATVTEEVKNIPPKERCHVIKNDPLIYHARKVNSSCQTIAPAQLENENACQKCEHHQVNNQNSITIGCNQKQNQKRINGEQCANADGVELDEINISGAYQQRSKDQWEEDTKLRESFSCKSLENIMENLKIQSNPLSRDTQRLIAELESELLNFQREFQIISSLTVPHDRSLGNGSTEEILKVQSKRHGSRRPENLEKEDENENEDQEVQTQTFPDFIAGKVEPHSWKQYSQPAASETQAGTLSISKESQTNLKSPTQMFCQLEKEKLLLMQKFRTSEMQTIQGDLNELHIFIKEQLNGIYQSITSEKFFSNDNRDRRQQRQQAGKTDKKSKQKTEQKTTQSREPPSSPLPLLSSSSSTAPSLTAETSSFLVLSSKQRMQSKSLKQTSILPRHYKKSSSPISDDNGNANKTKSTMEQPKSLLTAANAKADKTVGEKKSSKDTYQQLYGHHHQQQQEGKHLFASNCRSRCGFAQTDTPCFYCSDGQGGEKNHFSNVDRGCQSSFLSSDAAAAAAPRTQMNDEARRIMASKATRTSTTKNTHCHGPAVMMTHHQQPATNTMATTTTGIAQELLRLISSSQLSSEAARSKMIAAPAPYSNITTRRTTDDTSLNADTVTNAAVKTIIKDAYANSVTTNVAASITTAANGTTIMPQAAGHSNGIREPSYQTRNSWQRVNLKNPTGCQMKKQICGTDGCECTFNNNDNRSYYPEIHDCQKYRANSINPLCELCSTKMNEFGNGPFAPATDVNCDDDNIFSNDNYKHGRYDDGGGGDGFRDGGDGPINWMEENEKLLTIERDFSCHPEKRQQQRQSQRQWRKQSAKRMHCGAAQSTFQRTRFPEFKFKEYLDNGLPKGFVRDAHCTCRINNEYDNYETTRRRFHEYEDNDDENDYDYDVNYEII